MSTSETAPALARVGPAVRATVPPFHVMDVWAAAAERARTHGDLVNLAHKKQGHAFLP